METYDEVLISDPHAVPSAPSLTGVIQKRVEKAAAQAETEAKPRDTKDIFRDLLTYRAVVSEAAGIPLLGVFSRKAAQNIAILKPSSKEELLRVRGVGKDIAVRFGEDILEIIHDGEFSNHALEEQTYSLDQRATDGKTDFPKRAYTPWSKEEEAELIRLHSQGKTPQEISERLNRTLGAVKYRSSILELKCIR